MQLYGLPQPPPVIRYSTIRMGSGIPITHNSAHTERLAIPMMKTPYVRKRISKSQARRLHHKFHRVGDELEKREGAIANNMPSQQPACALEAKLSAASPS